MITCVKRLLEICACNELLVMNTWFQHTEIHRFTWECRKNDVRSIIHFLVRKISRADVQDVKMIRESRVATTTWW